MTRLTPATLLLALSSLGPVAGSNAAEAADGTTSSTADGEGATPVIFTVYSDYV